MLCRYYRNKRWCDSLHYAFIAHSFFQKIALIVYSHQLWAQLQLLCLAMLVDAVVVSVLLWLPWLVFTASIGAVKSGASVKHSRYVTNTPQELQYSDHCHFTAHVFSYTHYELKLITSYFNLSCSNIQICSVLMCTHNILCYYYYSFTFLCGLRDSKMHCEGTQNLMPENTKQGRNHKLSS